MTADESYLYLTTNITHTLDELAPLQYPKLTNKTKKEQTWMTTGKNQI